MIFDDAMALLAAMEREGVRYVMIGSMAMAANGLIRATRHVDFVVASDEENIARLRAALRSVFDDPSRFGSLAGVLHPVCTRAAHWPRPRRSSHVGTRAVGL